MWSLIARAVGRRSTFSGIGTGVGEEGRCKSTGDGGGGPGPYETVRPAMDEERGCGCRAKWRIRAAGEKKTVASLSRVVCEVLMHQRQAYICGSDGD